MVSILRELANRPGFFQCNLYDKAGSFEIPFEIMEAAQLLTQWAEENNFKHWRLNGVASRQQLEEMEMLADRPARIGEHVLTWAIRAGWEESSGEGAFEYVQRISYAQGAADAKAKE